MASDRKFYRSVFTVEVLSEAPLPSDLRLSEVAFQICDGDWSGHTDEDLNQEVDGPQMAKLLEAQGSEPGFFQLDENGNDVEDLYE